MDFEPIREQARQYFGDVSPSHDWHHVERVHQLSKYIARQEGADLRIVKFAAILHDIGRRKEDEGAIEDHAQWGADEASGILQDYDISKAAIEQVTHCIRAHRYSTNPEPATAEAECLSDADNLDALGAVGIARTFSYSGERKRPLVDSEKLPEEDQTNQGETGLNHLVKKILSLKKRLHTETARELAEERHQFVRTFVNRMKQEINGEFK